jgi:hypothetical protein
MERSVALALLAAITGCGPEFAVLPRGGVPQAQASSSGVTITAFAEQWESSPYDLADYVTPIAVDLYNGGSQEVRVAFADFQLRDERGVGFAALNPFAALMPLAQRTLDHLPRYAGRSISVGPPSGGRGASGGTRLGGRGGIWVGPPSGRRSYHGPFGLGLGPGWSGYQISGGLRAYYGPGAFYYSGGWIAPYYYGGWATRPTYDVLALALPEGVLPPGAHVNGFLYFKNATTLGPRRLDLAWTLADARTGAPLGALAVPLDVVHR